MMVPCSTQGRGFLLPVFLMLMGPCTVTAIRLQEACVTVRVTAPHHYLHGRFLRGAATLRVALCFCQAETVLGRRMALVTSMACRCVALRRPQGWSSSICGPWCLRHGQFLAAEVLKPCLACQGLSPGLTPEQFILQEKAIATLAKMPCESSASAVAGRGKTCPAALNSAGKKLIT